MTQHAHTKHTQGPWSYCDITAVVTTENPYGFFRVADCSNPIRLSVDQMNANARLIAAAPDLLNVAIMDNMFPATTEAAEKELHAFLVSLGWKMDMPDSHFASQYRRAAITRATGGQS